MTNDHKNRQPADVEANADRTEKDAARCNAGNNAREVLLVLGALIMILMLLALLFWPWTSKVINSLWGPGAQSSSTEQTP